MVTTDPERSRLSVLDSLLLAVGPLAALLARGPWPAAVRAGLAMVAVMAGPALALHPLWSRLEPARAAGRAAILTILPLLVLTAAGLMGVSVGPLAVGLLIAEVGAGALVWWKAFGRRPAAGAAGPPRLAARRALIGVALVMTVLAANRGTPLGASDDAMDHLAAIRHIIEADRVEFPGAYYSRDLPVGQDPRKGVLHVGLALAAVLADVDPLAVWRASAAVLTPLAALAFAALALALLESAGAALAALLALLLFWVDPGWIFKMAYGGHAALAVVWAVTAMLLAGEGPAFAALGGLAVSAAHAYGPAQLLAPLLLFRMLIRHDPEPLRWPPVIAVLVGALPVTVARMSLVHGVANPLHGQSMGWLLLGDRPIASPLQLAEWYGFTGLAAGAALLLVAPFRLDRTGRYLLASLLAPMALLLNPWLFGPVAARFGSVANKLALVWLYPVALIWLARTFSRTRGLGRVAVLAAALVLVPALVREVPMRCREWLAPPPPAPPRDLDSAARLIRAMTPPDAVIASDPRISYGLPALTGRRVIVTLHQHSTPGDGQALRRLEVASALFSECVPLQDALRRAVDEGAGWLFVPAAARLREDQFAWHPDPRNASVLAVRFPGSAPLTLVAESEGARLYRIDRTSLMNGDGADRGGVLSSGGPGVGATRVVSGNVQLAVEFPARPNVVRGTTIRLPAWWKRSAGGEDYEEYQAHIRLESDRLAEGGRGPFSKLWRRLLIEPRAGGALRARGVELPFRGLCPVAEWPAETWLADTLEVEVPGRLLPGPGRVGISLEKVGLYPRLRLADLLSNEDQFSGPTVARLEIE